MNKKGKLSSGVVNAAIVVIIVITVLLTAYSTLVPTAQGVADDMNDSNRCTAVSCTYNTSAFDGGVTDDGFDCRNQTGNISASGECANAANSIPLGNLFNPGGVVFIVLMAGLLILIVRGVLKKQ